MLNSRFSVMGNAVNGSPSRLARRGSTPLSSGLGGGAFQAGRSAKLSSPELGTNVVTANSAAMSVTQFGNSGLMANTTMRGLIPDTGHDDSAMLPLIRDIYAYDNVGGSAVDIQSGLPFSDWTLSGLDHSVTEIYSDTLARINMRTMLPEISNSYLVDGAFIGTLIYDGKQNNFQDVLMHDRMNAVISPQPFFALDPVITVSSQGRLGAFMDSYSPYAESSLKNYPQDMLRTFMKGNNVLDPITTLFIARKGTIDKTSVSYLKRLLPMYLLEKTLFRGTIVEATKRQRATTHIKIGDDTWEPTNTEMRQILAQFQEGDLDPLGAYIVTRQGVEVNDGLRQGGEFWKWTDSADVLVPYKLRALGISEAFLSADASLANAEAAITMFLDNMETYRQYLTYKLFYSKIFPLIAVLNGLYVDNSKVMRGSTMQALVANMSNQKNLKIPKVMWHKNLQSPNAPSVLDNLDKLSDKGFPVPLKAWAAAANVDIGSLLSDLAEDNNLRDRISAITGAAMQGANLPEGVTAPGGSSGGNDGDYGGGEGLDGQDDDWADDMPAEELAYRKSPEVAAYRENYRSFVQQATKRALPPTSIASLNPQHTPVTRRRNLLDREFAEFKINETGKVLPASKREVAKGNDNLVKALKNLSDPHRLNQVKARLREVNGGTMPKVGL